jgi:hypothetical protein
LACAWPVLIGRETLEQLRAGNPLDPERRIKVSRRRVRQLMLRSLLLYPWRGAWEKMGAQLLSAGRGQLVQAINK